MYVAKTRQRGMALVVTLIMLVIMTLGAIAMVRSMDTTTLIAGNLGFRQSATYSGDVGVEAAMAWQRARSVATLTCGSPTGDAVCPAGYKSNGGNGGSHAPAESTSAPKMKIGDICPECGEAAVVNEEGCRKCYACGYSEC